MSSALMTVRAISFNQSNWTWQPFHERVSSTRRDIDHLSHRAFGDRALESHHRHDGHTTAPTDIRDVLVHGNGRDSDFHAPAYPARLSGRHIGMDGCCLFVDHRRLANSGSAA